MRKTKIGEELLIVNSTQKVTVISELEGVIMLLFHGSGEPFVVTDSYDIEDGKIRWFGSRYRKDINGAVEIFNSLIEK